MENTNSSGLLPTGDPSTESKSLGASKPLSQAIVLAGGLGTRLRSAVPDLPKSMAPIAGKPFIGVLIRHFWDKGINNFVISLGYRSEIIRRYLESSFDRSMVQFAEEIEPLGTGGAIRLACQLATTQDVLVLNGDTFFDIDLPSLFDCHEEHRADCTLALKPMQDAERYGVVELQADLRIGRFKEKQPYQSGLINGGVYVLNRLRFLTEANLPDKFSFEKDYLESNVHKRRFFGLVQDRYFIDIGIPEDYERANRELAKFV